MGKRHLFQGQREFSSQSVLEIKDKEIFYDIRRRWREEEEEEEEEEEKRKWGDGLQGERQTHEYYK